MESLLRRTDHKADSLYKADKDFAPIFLVFWSNSVKSNLYKADNSIKRTPFYGPNGVRFREIPLYLKSCTLLIQPPDNDFRY